MVVGDMIRMTASRDPAKIGIVSDEVQLSWRQFNERINALANAMLSLGMQKGERVAILGRHSHRYLEWYLAVAKAGLVGVPLNTWLKGGELSYLLRDSGASVLFLDPDYTARAHSKQIPNKTGVGSNYSQYENAEVDKLLELGVTQSNTEDRKKTYARVQEILSEEVPFAPQGGTYQGNLKKKQLQGVKPTGYTVNCAWNIHEWGWA